MRLLVCGGRRFRERSWLRDVLAGLHRQSPITLLINGNAPGADALALEWAAEEGVPTSMHAAAWDRYGAAAGPRRNAQMLLARPDIVVAFPGGRGTADMVRRARAAGVRVIEPMR
jgi:hypothetical protein